MSLEFVSTKTLLDELQKRKTFAGVFIYSQNEHYYHGQTHNDFDFFSSLDKENTVLLLDRILAGIQKEGN